MDLHAVAEVLKELSGSLRRIALAFGFLAVRMSSLYSDKPVVRVPRGLQRFTPEPPVDN